MQLLHLSLLGIQALKQKAAGASVKLDVSKMQYGQQIQVAWRKQPVFVVRHTKESLENIDSALPKLALAGIPARPIGDGPDGHSLWPGFKNVPNEFLEAYFPLRIVNL